MSVNLNKNRSQILAAWKDVVDDKTPTDWALFGYEGQTNDLIVISKGDGGIDELREDLNSGKIMYAFCKVLDPKTSLKKFVLINWQGEGAPLVRKGVCANHVRDVANILNGFHVTVNARTEEDIDADLIIEKVEKSTASTYSFVERLDLSKDGYQKVDPSYKKVEPHKEINPVERNKFWAEEEEQEKRRQQEEIRKRQEEQLRIEKECMEREAVEASKREQYSNEPESKNKTNQRINDIKEETRRISELRKIENNAPCYIPDKSEELRKMRNKEAEELISKRTVNARALFEQNTSFGQLTKFNKSSDKFKVEDPVSITSNKINENGTKEIVQDSLNGVNVSEITTATQPEEREGIANYTTPTVPQPQELEELQSAVSENQIYLSEEFGIQAQALYDYQAADDTEISFDPGDLITHIEQIDPGWWQGLAPDGTFGLFPANYVQLLQE